MKVINFKEEKTVVLTNRISLSEERFNDDGDSFSNFIKENFNVKTFDELSEKLYSGKIDAGDIVIDYANLFDRDGRDAFDDIECNDDRSEIDYEIINNDNL